MRVRRSGERVADELASEPGLTTREGSCISAASKPGVRMYALVQREEAATVRQPGRLHEKEIARSVAMADLRPHTSRYVEGFA